MLDKKLVAAKDLKTKMMSTPSLSQQEIIYSTSDENSTSILNDIDEKKFDKRLQNNIKQNQSFKSLHISNILKSYLLLVDICYGTCSYLLLDWKYVTC